MEKSNKMGVEVHQQRKQNVKTSVVLIFRMLVFCACTTIICIIFAVSWFKWFPNPDSIEVKENLEPVWKIPFPAVTICSESKIRQTLFNFSENYHERSNLLPDALAKFELLSLVCSSHIVQNGSKFTDNTSLDLMKYVAPDLQTTLLLCMWRTTMKKCEEIFNPIITEEGLCFTSNMIQPHEMFRKEMDFSPYSKHGNASDMWSSDDGYSNDAPFDVYPMRGSDAGALSGMTIVLRSENQDIDPLCRGTSRGFKISLHSPSDFPTVSQQYFHVPFGRETMIRVKPNMFTTSDDLKKENPQKRNCYYSKERKLKYFRVYTKKNCEMECLSNYTMMLCDCVTMSLPRDASIPVCSAGSIKCAMFARSDLAQRESKVSLNNNIPNENELEEVLNELASSCDCLPSCTSLEYDYEISQTDYDTRKVYEAYNENVTRDESMARAVIFFKDSRFVAHERSKPVEKSALLLSLIAILGILLAFSLIGMVDSLFKVQQRFFYREDLGLATNVSSDSTNDNIKKI
ncbi:pickpocket protein 28-like [Arctopsyche grandis]|uniref:pickpocket protein 28-like n=1 Tax=Arctopsyche grandis TaxID=121162 RepID=UPI00406D776C